MISLPRSIDIIVVTCALVLASRAHAQATVITYQGELTNAGQPANGTFDMAFGLWTESGGGLQVGPTVSIDDVIVTGGRFTVELDFGAAVFDMNRWLEITVEGFTLAPRQSVSASPYALQTRGIFVSDAGDVGLGTDDPQRRLHVVGDVASSGPDAQFITHNPNNEAASISMSWLDDVARLRIGGTGVGAAGGLDIQRTGDASLLRILHDGSVGIGTTNPQAKLHVLGDGIFDGLTSGAIAATHDNAVFPTIFATNTNGGPCVWLDGANDASFSSDGLFMAGRLFERNVIIDDNEIMARFNGGPSTLYLNNDGGEVSFGDYQVHPALAYGHVAADASIVSASSNVLTASRTAEGIYEVTIVGGLAPTDVTLVSPVGVYRASANELGSVLSVTIGRGGGDFVDSAFSFVIYRP